MPTENFIRNIDPQTVGQWKELFMSSIAQLNDLDEKESYNATPLVQRTDINHNNLDNVN